MAIESISSVVNRGYAPNFEGKKDKSQSRPGTHVTSPLKAVPLAVLIAMSPLTETSAREIMRPINEVTALAQGQQKENIIYAYTFDTEKLSNVKVEALNTRGNLDGFDKIRIRIGDYDFDVKEVIKSNLYLVSADERKEGPLIFREVKTEFNGKQYTFLDQNVAGFVASIVENFDGNKSNISKIKSREYNFIFDSVYEQFYKINQEETANIFEDYKNNKSNIKGIVINEKEINGSNGKYKLRFYDKDGNKNNYEDITLQKNGYGEFSVDAIYFLNTKLTGLDTDISTGDLNAIGLARTIQHSERTILDDTLAEYIQNLLNNDSGNNIEGLEILKGTSEINL